MKHDLKCWPDEFASIDRGEQLHDVRRADRPYAVGDVLVLREWVPEPDTRDWDGNYFCTYCSAEVVACDKHRGAPLPGRYTGRSLERVVTHLTPGGAWGLPSDLCVMSIAGIDDDAARARAKERQRCHEIALEAARAPTMGDALWIANEIILRPPPQTPPVADDTPAK